VREALISETDRWFYKLLRSLLTSSLFKKVVVSDESISMGRMSFWEPQARTPEQLAKSLEKLKFNKRRPPLLKVVIGFRNPTTWIASRYAQSASGFQNPGQADFETRIDAIFSNDNSSNGMSWLDRKRVVLAFSNSLGASNVFDFSQEELDAEPAQTVTGLLSFIEFDSSFIQNFVNRPNLSVRHNSKSIGDGVWQLRGMDATITLSTEIVARINSALRRR
jgi:hypothetical protein